MVDHPEAALARGVETERRSPAHERVPKGAFSSRTIAETLEATETSKGTSPTSALGLLSTQRQDEGTQGALRADRGARYEERQLLGSGGMGVVTLAIDHGIGREVALKRPHAGVGHQAHVDAFLREVRTVGQLEHPNIVPIHDVGVDRAGRPYFVMKHLEGETLERVIERLREGEPEATERYSFEVRIGLFMSLLRALELAHARGIVHRDIKPANVMIGRYGEVVLMDWGLARSVDDTDTPRGKIVGTPYYMSPEQARGESERLDARSDIYSACVLFHELLAVRHYLEPIEDPVDVLRIVGREGWRVSMMGWHRSGGGPVPPMELYHFLRRGLAFDPDERWQSASAMLAALQAILEGRFHVQCHITLVKRLTRAAGRFVDRRPWTAFAIFALTLGAALFGAGSAVLRLLG